MPLHSDPEAWQPHFDAVQERALRSLARCGVDRERAQDLWQETLSQILSAGASPDPTNNPHAYIWTALRRTAQHGDRRRRILGPIGGDDVLALVPDNGSCPAETCLQREQAGQVRDAVRALPHRFQSVIRLRFLEGWSLTEVATKLGIPNGTAASRCHRALHQMRERLSRSLAWILVQLGKTTAIPRLAVLGLALSVCLTLPGASLGEASAVAPEVQREEPSRTEPDEDPESTERPTYPTRGFPYGGLTVVLRPHPEL